jgi:hypothetical protein
MTGYRATATIVTLLVSAAWGAAPALGAGSPLLSGYGGPGEGNQAILGSTLVGASGAGPGEGAPGSPGGLSSDAEGIAASTGLGGGGAGSRHASGTAGRRGGGAQSPGRGSNGRPTAVRAGVKSGPPVSLTEAGDSQTLGLSSEDVVYILIALGALAVTGALTGRLARRSH